MIKNIDSRRKQRTSFGHILPYLKFLAAKSRQAGRKTKRFFSILSQEADIKAAQREAIAATNGVGLPPKPLIIEGTLKAAPFSLPPAPSSPMPTKAPDLTLHPASNHVA